ncbi:hypothetical protein ACMD2_14296 [Ananas comosus]|uniref:Uncharacterized protein n=1 Tax=Ananas comosus TaxID=4615 RepID=A0A199UZ83_ANACO|nr:hypothetical protein ACMD2_14296 [Ananas comosus]
MARSARGRRLSTRQLRPTPYPIPSYSRKAEKQASRKKTPLASLEKKDWEDATCSVCMEYPHNAVLLLCSSHNKGCRPYMCGTSYRHSNCLDQFEKAYTKETSLNEDSHTNSSLSWPPSEKSEVMELSCPLCRGQVKGWTVVERAREYLNTKKRTCMQDGCSYMGTYKELKRHVRSEHPSAKPREVDPVLEQKWRTLEHERERQDVISTIRSTMPRSVVFGDYVIEMGDSDGESDEEIGDANGDFRGGGRGISRSILYFLFRESARLMRLHRENNNSAIESRDEDNSYAPINGSGGSGDLNAAYPSDDDDEVDPVMARGGGMGVVSSERRRRRRRRSRGRLVMHVG